MGRHLCSYFRSYSQGLPVISGGVKFFLDVGFERWELNTDINNIDLANGQAHEVIMRRENRGRDVYLQVSMYSVTVTIGFLVVVTSEPVHGKRPL